MFPIDDVPGIHVPRPGIMVDAFVLMPMQDMAPTRLHPETGQSYVDLWPAMVPNAAKLELFPLSLQAV